MKVHNPIDLDVVRHARARRAKLSVDPVSGRVRLTLPPRAALKPALAWAEKHRPWIEAQCARLPQARPFVAGGTLPLEGVEVTIDWQEGRPRRIVREPDRLVCGGPAEGLGRRIALWLRREALRVLAVETAEFAARAGVSVTQVAVGDARGRWGSCSSSGAIRYSWRLVLMPTWVRRATVAHEVAHRVHMNHGAGFHALERSLAERDPAEVRAWLRANGAALHWVGRES
ncbi:M48 family metallopeptidase [Sphingomonas aracearum]|uniref:M48 family peptidase n=1 Tax=Sphingomonas aracearum TaxID=2283317 RepID=A0A369VTW6_9SPHN|nr:SprT family zinc-dependent metalloprotease [Sphingomonas aracearum]RDE04640.1 M48 family peptidase [Sphingomonas aracearum]